MADLRLTCYFKKENINNKTYLLEVLLALGRIRTDEVGGDVQIRHSESRGLLKVIRSGHLTRIRIYIKINADQQAKTKIASSIITSHLRESRWSHVQTHLFLHEQIFSNRIHFHFSMMIPI